MITASWRRLALCTAITLAAAVAPPADAQQADQDSTPTASQNFDSDAVLQQHTNEHDMPASGEATTQETKSFSGQIVKENGELVLEDTVTKVSHKLDSAAKAKEYFGKRVKVTGKLDPNNNTIRVEKIEPLS